MIKSCPNCGEQFDRHHNAKYCETCAPLMVRKNADEWHARNPKKSAEYRKKRYANHKELVNSANEKWRKANWPRLRDIARIRDFKKKYGLTMEEYQVRVDEQHGQCAICNGPPTINNRLYVDHDHVTGAVRGLLCQACNSGLGYFKDNAELLKQAVIYRESYN